MMQNTSSQPLNNKLNGHSPPLFLPPEPFPWAETEDNDWDLSQFLGLLKRRALIIASVATTVMAGVTYTTLTQQPQYEGNFRLLVEPVSNENNLSELTGDSDSNSQAAKSGLDYETQIQVLKSFELINAIVKELNAKYPDISYESLMNSLTINRFGETNIIEVRYQDGSPNQVKEVLDTVAKNYLEYSLEERQTQLNQGIRFVDKELPPVKKRVDNLQKQLQTFRLENDFFDPNSQSGQVNDQLKQLAEQRQQVEQQLAKAEANFAALQQENGALVILRDASVYQELVTQLRQLETQIAEESTRFQEDAPTMRRLREKRQKIFPLLEQEKQRILNLSLSEVANQIQQLKVQRQQISDAENNLSQRKNQLPNIARRYTELQQNLKIANGSLDRFLTTRQNLQIEAAQTELPWELIKAPTKPTNPVSPNIQRNFILGFVASALLGIGAAFLREKFDNTYRNVDALKDDLKLPLLGALPIDKNLEKNQNRTSKVESFQDTQVDAVPEFSPRFHPESAPSYFQESGQFVEALRVVHTNLKLLSGDRPIRSIVISSALAMDGKSTVAYNLALIAASMGQKVLLVDTDLRRPQVHALTGLPNLWGLTNLISGNENMPAEQVMQELPEIPGFSVITSGAIPPDPTKLLSSIKMKQLVEEFHQKFDLIIYDSPPLTGLADATLLAPQTDGIVLVVRMDKTERNPVKKAIDNLKTSRTNVLGVIANGDKSMFHKYYQKYYHS